MENRVKKSVFLIGFMGVGKSSITLELGHLLGLDTVEMDDYIVQQEGRSIPEIFDQDGEGYFRQVERTVVVTLGEGEPRVISCGGGAMLNPDSADYARKNGAVVLLDESFDTCYGRIQGDTNRPIVQRSTREELHQLFDKRSGTYRAHASHVIPGGVSPEEMAERIMAAVNA